MKLVPQHVANRPTNLPIVCQTPLQISSAPVNRRCKLAAAIGRPAANFIAAIANRLPNSTANLQDRLAGSIFGMRLATG